ncbi:uncharacterized protein AMSG_06456 [Thecamonas trahens ATCC 50062]|uniref:IgGFc-binding protein N-terminal domain-containing protein n=1 Tax=Thecamonas trahens ATCC 50062 TaxID=461836 RepID=A0A0L0DG72_THETB|nr:hypothetical protein AMSG_06456 [Thecamonas trahens ATCC 50062]KNC51111.1 hypothetical protein AMSG_06456 [Thecamonas trahens ATCC 50062]|eukprot:XP_013756319.1 hypothetical protein AMSG_06456 [Thecamonas trahens ATCC 50062]
MLSRTLTIILVVTLVILAQASASAPSYVGKILVSSSGSFARFRVQYNAGNPNRNVMYMAGSTIVAVSPSSPTQYSSYSLPAGTDSPVGIFLYGSVGGYVAITPQPDKLVVLNCAQPSNPYGGSCSLTQAASITLPVAASTEWVDIGIGFTRAGERYLYLVSSNRTIAVVDAPPGAPAAHWSVVRVVTIASAVTAHYPYVVGLEGGDNMDMVFVSLAAADPRSASGGDPGVILTLDARTSAVTHTTFVSRPAFTSTSGGSADLVAVVGALDNSTAIAHAFSDVSFPHGYQTTWPSAGPIAAGCTVDGAVTAFSMPLYVVASLGGSGLSLRRVAPVAGTVSPSASSPDTAAYGIGCYAAVDSLSGGENTWIPAIASGTNVVLVYASPPSLVPTKRTPAKHALARVRSTAVGSSAPGCVDPDMGTTCLEACDPLPAVICSPIDPGPSTVDGRPAACFLLPSHPDSCNFCPPAWAQYCP